jgi:GntR family transcriptional repressor for pyruvate dehydrogenase complex
MNAPFDEIRHQPRSQQIVNRFRTAIAEGSLNTGDRLPPERELCVQLGVSRTSLREAIRILETYGLVESTQGGGTYITDKFSENVFEFLGFGKKLHKRNFKYLLNARKILESGAVEQALEAAETGENLPRCGDFEAVNLDSLVDEQEKETDPGRLGILDARFHEKLVGMSHNPIIVALYHMIHRILCQGISEVIAYPPSRRIVLRDHREIARAFIKRNRRACVRAVRKHLKNTEKLIEEYLQEED